MDGTSMLLEIVKRSKVGHFEGSTASLAKPLGMSQQSVSRKLIEMEKAGFIRRTVTQKGLSIALNAKGKELLADRYGVLKLFFENDKVQIHGKVKSGLGEGKYYMSQEEYQKQFIEKLGFKAYPGTLNLSVDSNKAMIFLNSLSPIRINGFERKERTFGALTVYKVKIVDTEGAIVIPDRTTHDSTTLEVIAPVYLRTACKIKDGSSLELRGI